MTWFVSFFIDYLRPVLDVLILTCILYQIYKLILQNKVIQVVKGLLIIISLYAVAFICKLDTLLWILGKMANAFIIIVAIVFQNEIKDMIVKISQTRMSKKNCMVEKSEVDAIISAAEKLSEMKRGALLVFARQTNLKQIVETGTKINADIVSELIVTVFGMDTALHDGAMIIQGKKIVAAGCYLPLSQQKGLNKNFGTRHRAAVGITETTDAVVLVVSEETGAISIAFNSKIYYDLGEEELKKNLQMFIREGSLGNHLEEEAV